MAIIALGAFHPVIKVQSASMHFFLGSDQEVDEEDSEDEVRTKLEHIEDMLFTRLAGSRRQNVAT